MLPKSLAATLSKDKYQRGASAVAKGILVSVQALEGAAVAGALIFKDQVQTALFNEDKFVLRFSDEIISEMQVQGVLSGDYLISTQAEVMFGPQLCSLG